MSSYHVTLLKLIMIKTDIVLKSNCISEAGKKVYLEI